MSESMQDMLQQILADVMEQMAFMFVRGAHREDVVCGEAEFVMAEMRFSGALEGMLTLVASRRMCDELSANILGLDDEEKLVQDNAIDAFKEILNVICGHVLTGLAGADARFMMSPPVEKRLTHAEWEGLELSPSSYYFSVEEHPLLLQIDLKGPEPCPSAC